MKENSIQSKDMVNVGKRYLMSFLVSLKAQTKRANDMH